MIRVNPCYLGSGQNPLESSRQRRYSYLIVTSPAARESRSISTQRTSFRTFLPIPVAALSSSLRRTDCADDPDRGASIESLSRVTGYGGVIGTGRFRSLKNTAAITPRFAVCPSFAPYESRSLVK